MLETKTPNGRADRIEIDGDAVLGIAYCLTIPLSLASIILTIIFKGWMIGRGFNLFLAPVIHADAISTPVACGIYWLAGMFGDAPKADDDKPATPGTLMKAVVRAWIINLICFVTFLVIAHFAK